MNYPTKLKYRTVLVKNNGEFKVSPYIVRIDIEKILGYRGTHGWQVRYQRPWKFFSDSKFKTPKKALYEAQQFLIQQKGYGLYRRLNLKKVPHKNKTNHLPVGISPSSDKRRNTIVHYFQIKIPLSFRKHGTKKVYIGTENTITPKRTKKALAKSINIRNRAIKNYQYNYRRA